MAQGRCGNERRVLNPDAVEHLEPVAQTAHNRDGVFDRRFVDEHRLEASGQSGVLLDVLAVFVERGGPDHVEFAARQHGLEHVAGIHRTLGRTRADDGVQFVDQEQDPSLSCLYLGEYRLEPFLELASILGSGDQRTQVEREDGLVLQPFWDIAVDDALREAFDDGRLADARVADQDRVVLRLAGQDLDDAPDLGVAADDGVELARACLGDKVTSVLGQRLVGDLGRRRRDPLVAPHPSQRRKERFPGDAIRLEFASGRGGRTLLGQCEQEMLDRYVLVLEPTRLSLRGVEYPRQALGHEYLTRRGAGA